MQTFWDANDCNHLAAPPLDATTCQAISDRYETDDGISQGFAPPDVQAWWQSHGCHTHPSPKNLCQRYAATYGIIPNVTWGSAPAGVQADWDNNSCNPFASMGTCQLLSDGYGLSSAGTSGVCTPLGARRVLDPRRDHGPQGEPPRHPTPKARLS